MFNNTERLKLTLTKTIAGVQRLWRSGLLRTKSGVRFTIAWFQARGGAAGLWRSGLHRTKSGGRFAIAWFQARGGAAGLRKLLRTSLEKLKPHVRSASSVAKRHSIAAVQGSLRAALAAKDQYRKAGGHVGLWRGAATGIKQLRPVAVSASRTSWRWAKAVVALGRTWASRAKIAFREQGGVPGQWRRIRQLPAYLRTNAVPSEGSTGLRRQVSRASTLWRSGKTGRVCLISASGVLGLLLLTPVLLAVFADSPSRSTFCSSPPPSPSVASEDNEDQKIEDDLAAELLMRHLIAQQAAMVDPMQKVNQLCDQMQRRRDKWKLERQQRNRDFSQQCYQNAQHELDMATWSIDNGDTDTADVELDSAERWKSLGDRY